MMRKQKQHIQQNEKERGQSLVELAVSFTLIVLVLAGVVDFGRAFFALIALRDAAQEGVIYASVHPGDVTGIEQRVQNSSDSPINMANIPDTDIDITYNVGGTPYFETTTETMCAGFYDAGGTTESNWVKVSVEYPFPFTMPIIQQIFPGGYLRLVVDDIHTILAPECK